jgi:L-iditol 2-dehydrogenase
MWSHRLVAPYTFERTDVPPVSPESLAPGQVLLNFVVAGVCGSDLPAFRGTKGRLPFDTGVSAAGKDGFPIHEIVGDVIASRHPRHDRGDRVVGWASGFDGLMEQVVADGDGLAPYDPALTPQLAVALQPLACVLYGVEQLPDLRGKDVAVIGQGSIGLLFSYLAKASGAAHVTGVDPIDRETIGPTFGVDTVIRATSDRWVSHLVAADKPNVVIEAVGHQVATLGHAIEATAFGGTAFYFGVPDDDSYPISMRTMLRNNLTLKSGVTLDRRRALERADAFAREHPDLLPNYLTHTFGVDDVQAAFELASRPTPGRIKIAIVR